MRKKSNITLGPGAPSLILIFVVLALSMLSMLALMNGRNDAKLGERSVKVTQAVYALNVQAEQTFAGLDELLSAQAQAAKDDAQYISLIKDALPEDMEMDGRIISWTQTDELRNLHCCIEVLPLGDAKRVRWTKHTLVSQAAEGAEDEGVEFDW